MIGPAARLPQPAAVRVAGGACESCGRRPAAGWVVLDTAEPFAVCADCAPSLPPPPVGSSSPRAVADHGDPEPESVQNGDGVPPLDWSGVITIRQPWTAVAQPIGLIVAAGAVSFGTYWFGGHTTGSFLAMIIVGSLAGIGVAWLDRRLLGSYTRSGPRRIRR